MRTMRTAVLLGVIVLALSSVAAQTSGSPLYDEEVLRRLERTGLVVLPDGTDTNLHDCYYGLEMSGQPIYVTADAMLYLWYEAHRQALMAAEKQWLRPQLVVFTERLLKATKQLRASGGSDPLLRANAVMLEVVWALLDPAHEPAADIAAEVNAELARVREHKLVQEYPGEDYTQYEVRGYYTRNAELSNYFRGAKYLARRYFRVADAKYPADADRELRRALLLALAMGSDPGLTDLYRQIVDLRVFLCGPIDTIGLDQVLSAANSLWGDDWSSDRLADLAAIRRELLSDKYPTTRINTRITTPDLAMMPPKNIALLGEHYLPDSDLFHQITEPRIAGRHLPSGLDVGTALGSPLAADKLREQTVGFPQVAPNAEAFGKAMKLDGIYGSWLQTLRTLFDQPAGLPDFAKTPTYEAKQLNCCLTSWAHLRHNYILYGAQANTCAGVGGASPGLVEPLPGFFAAYGKLCRELREKLVACRIDGRSVIVLDLLEKKAATFERCATDQLAGGDISWARSDIHFFASFVQRVYFDTPLLVADVATSSQTREVLHAASGPFHKVLVRYLVGEQPVIAQGWVGSYYEFTEPALGRVTDEEWQQRLQRQYDTPRPPEWLAGLYQPQPGEETGQRQALRQIEALLAADKYDEAAQAAETFIKQEQETEWAPRAVLMLASYLGQHKRREESLAMLERARPMYGCEARDTAMARIRNYRTGEGREAWEERQAERERKFAAQLAATDPREGLTEAQEVERQNQRAALLVSDRGFHALGATGTPENNLRRLLAECPKSGYIPFAELALPLQRLPDRYTRSATDEEPDGKLYRQVRTELLDLVRRYPTSAVGQAAHVAACSVLMLMRDHEAAYQEVLPLLGLEPPKPEPYPLSKKMLDDLNYSGPGGAMTSAPDLLHELLDRLVPRACRAGDLPRLREYVDLTKNHPTGVTYGDWEELPVIVEYLQDEPEPLRALLSLGLVNMPGYGYEFATEETGANVNALVKQGLQVADQYPKGKSAPAALFRLWLLAKYGSEQEAQLQEIVKRLSAQYPTSLECLVVQAHAAADRDDHAGYQQLMAKLSARVPDQNAPRPATYPQLLLGQLHGTRAPVGPPDAVTLAQWKKRYGKFIPAAKLSDEALRACKAEPKLVSELIKRLPQHELQIVLTYSKQGEPYIWTSLINDALQRHPTHPLSHELRFRRGTTDDMAAIIAAGPKTPHFQEAVERLVAWQPGNDQRRSLDADLHAYRQLAARHAGTPVEPLAGAVMAGIYLHYERPEQALQFLTKQLAAVSEGPLFRDRLLAAQENAQRQIALKRAAAHPPLWTTPLTSSEDPFTSDTKKPGLLLSPDGHRVYACGVLADTRHGIVALDTKTGHRVWEAPCPDLLCLQSAGDDLIFSTGHGTVGRMEGRTGKLVWETSLGLAQTGKVVTAVEGDIAAVAWDQGVLLGLELTTGKIVWQRNEHIDTIRMSPGSNGDVPLSVCAGVICAWDQRNTLHAWGISDGEPLWSLTVAQVLDQPAAEVSLGRSLLWPVACGGQIVSGTNNFETRVILSVDPSTGKTAWRKPFPEQVSLLPAAMRHSSAVFLYGGKQTAEWGLGDGSLRWTLPVPGGEEREPQFAAAGDYVLLVAGDVLVLDRRTGQIVARQPLVGVEHPRCLIGQADGDAVHVILATDQEVRAYSVPISK